MVAEPVDQPDPNDGGSASDLDPGVLERAILGDERVYTAAEVATETGVDLEQARRLWRALGFPEYAGETAFTAADARALATITGLVSSGLIDFDLATNLTRAVGQTMARLADWEVSALVQRVQEQPRDRRAELGRAMIDSFAAPFEELLIYVWRRHLAAATGRMAAFGADHDEVPAVRLTVGFADLVSFTALSNTLSEDRIGDLVELFEGRCTDVIATHRGRTIKSIGDSVLFVHDDPIEAYAIAEGIIHVIGRDPRMPDVRLGLASGPVVMRLGDVFGPPVNMAARLTAVARRNRIIVDSATADQLPDDQFESRRLPARPVRGFGVVEPVAVRRH